MNITSLLIFICLLFVANCRMSGSPVDVVPILGRNKFSGKTISVYSPDRIAGGIVCDSIRETGYFKEVYCFAEKVKEQNFDYNLFVTAKLNNPSLDYGRNVALSLASLTTYAGVSVSADTDFYFTVRRKNRTIYEKTHSSRARIGMWAVLPIWAGFFGTTIGTVLNSHRNPVQMQRKCLRDGRKQNLYNGEAEGENCGDYKELIDHGYNKIYFTFLQNLISATSRSSGGEVTYENKIW